MWCLKGLAWYRIYCCRQLGAKFMLRTNTLVAFINRSSLIFLYQISASNYGPSCSVYKFCFTQLVLAAPMSTEATLGPNCYDYSYLVLGVTV
jgi:hypothetical protein